MDSTVIDRAIVCLDLPPVQACENVRQSLAHAANRWHARLIRIENPICDAHPYWQKLAVCRWLRSQMPEIQRVVQLDNDILIRSDCPSLFDLVPEPAFGCYMFGGLHTDKFKDAHRRWSAKTGLQEAPLWRHPNAGVYVYSMAHHAAMFYAIDWETVGQKSPTLAGLPDESLVACYCHTHDIPISCLPPAFNCLASEWPMKIRENPMHAFIQHYNLPGGKKHLLPVATWRVPADHPQGLPGAGLDAMQQ